MAISARCIRHPPFHRPAPSHRRYGPLIVARSSQVHSSFKRKATGALLYRNLCLLGSPCPSNASSAACSARGAPPRTTRSGCSAEGPRRTPPALRILPRARARKPVRCSSYACIWTSAETSRGRCWSWVWAAEENSQKGSPLVRNGHVVLVGGSDGEKEEQGCEKSVTYR